MLINYRVSLDFAGYNDPDLDEFASHVVTSMTDNSSFLTPPVPIVDFAGIAVGFHDAVVAALPGGILLTAAKNAARASLLDVLRQLASYVQGIANHTLDILLTSGFSATSTNRAQSPLDKPVIILLDNLATTQLLLRLTPITNAKAYQLQISTNVGGWQDAGIYTQARRIVLANLTPGTVYNVRARAVGGTTGFSEWSDPVSHIAT